MKKTKKIDPKMTFKGEAMAIVTKALTDAGYAILSGEDFGFTKGTLVVRGESFDMQLKPITPKAGIERYEIAEEDSAE